ncbi:zinc-binding dehydrogenase [Streptomyces sp. NPDC050509]|uniref:zinc-binding dehydrogenase n=1 Tax=Streptomyces sp. NPDC050509 TaxID=3365620 RepID=UPI0037B4193F
MIGAGGVGLAVVQVAVAAGATVIAVGPHGPSRAQALRHSAAQATACPLEAVREITDGHGCHVVVDTVGTGDTPGLAVGMTRPRGRVVLFGCAGAPAALDVLADGSVVGRLVITP